MSFLHQDQYTKETRWAWTHENPPVVGSHSPDFQGLRCLPGGPGTHIEVHFTLYRSLCGTLDSWVLLLWIRWLTESFESLSGDFSSSMTKASWGKSPWTTFQWGDPWMRLCGWCRPSSTRTNTAKVQPALLLSFHSFKLIFYAHLHTWDFFFSSCVHRYSSIYFL